MVDFMLELVLFLLLLFVFMFLTFGLVVVFAQLGKGIIAFIKGDSNEDS